MAESSPVRQTEKPHLHRREWLFLAAALLIYLFTRLFRLADFPIYFFTDEAVQSVLAADFVRDGFYNYDRELLPTYFYNGYQYNLGVSVYLQVLPYMLFGKSVWLTRALPAVLSVLGAAALGLTIRQVFRLPHAWAGVLLLSITPAWFLHSRTAFETGLAVTFFALFLYFYLRYRSGSSVCLCLATAAGALTFYSYSPARLVIGLTALLLFFSDLPYHRRRWKIVLPAFALTLLLALPLLRFTLAHPTAAHDHLTLLRSYWVEPMPLIDKLGIFAREYLRGLNPLYWYRPNNTDMPRHLMKGYGHVLWWTFPFLLIGLGKAIRNFRQPQYRALLIALLAAPAGAALAALGVTRALCMLIPLALLSAIGLSWTVEQIIRLLPRLRQHLPGLAFAMLALVNLLMTADALRNGPLWYQEYGLGGMQWGARQLFGYVDQYLREHPDADLIVSPSWGNGTDVTARFFFPDPLPFQMGSINGYMTEKKPLDENTRFVMLPSEYENMLESGKFRDVRVEQTIPCPNGQACFLFVRLAYVDGIDDIFAQEQAARRVLQTGSLNRDGEIWQVRYSHLDLGSIEDAFDGDPATLLRTSEANPLVAEVDFPNAKNIQKLSVKVGGPPAIVDVYILDVYGEVTHLTRTIVQTPSPRWVIFDLDEMLSAVRLRLEVTSVLESEPAHVHLWEISIE
jgi:4-amino-4-deoxy-L-arabinose transferase-like glycosyltransferase